MRAEVYTVIGRPVAHLHGPRPSPFSFWLASGTSHAPRVVLNLAPGELLLPTITAFVWDASIAARVVREYVRYAGGPACLRLTAGHAVVQTSS